MLWIAQQVADSKFSPTLTPLFRKAKLIAGKRPSVLISEGAPNFNDAFKQEFFTRRMPRSRHIKHIRLQGDHNDNKIERLNQEVRDREIVMRSLKKIDTPILAGYQLFIIICDHIWLWMERRRLKNVVLKLVEKISGRL